MTKFLANPKLVVKNPPLMSRISCFIIAKNEEEKIAKAINSVKNIVEEVILIDSGSTDKTIQIAESLGAKIVYNKWPGYLKQKIYGESLCKNDWILNIDADEELTPSLQEEIDLIDQTDLISNYKAYRINFVILHRNENKPRRFAPANSFIRLYNKKHAAFAFNKGDSTHDDVKLKDVVDVKKDIYLLTCDALHRSGTSIEHLTNKANFYSGEQASAMFKRGRSVSNLRLIFEFPLWVFKAFIIRRYFVFGVDGFVDSMIFAYARFIRLAKLRELQNNKK